MFTLFYISNLITRLFPLWVILFSCLAWWQPQWFMSAKPAIMPLLALIMFAMGLTLKVADFKRVMTQPLVVVIGVVLQFGLMPLLAWLIATLLELEPMIAVGLILVGACSGGTASNVMTYLAGGNVALSITMTAVSTLLAVFMTPWLSWLYIDTVIDVPIWAMFKSILLLVILPVAAGVFFNRVLSRFIRPILTICPMIAVLAIVFIIAIVVALNHSRMAELSWLIVLAVALHNVSGLALGYWVARLVGYSSVIARTLAIEVDMQNSGLAVALALNFFTPLAALPGAIFSIWHNISGSMFATLWQWCDRSHCHDSRD